MTAEFPGIDPATVPELGFETGPIVRREGPRAINAEGRAFVDLAAGRAAEGAEAESAAARWAAALAAAAEAESLNVVLADASSAPAVVFAGQEGAPGALMGAVFQAVMRVNGVLMDGRLRVPAGLEEADSACVELALTLGLRRMRALLVELNSYLSGGYPFPFEGAGPLVRERGVAFYRFPKEAVTSIEPGADSLRIRFAAGDLGQVTSSGFYVPTSLVGDFVIAAKYRILAWEPGADAASFALFVQDDPSLFRAYVQRSSCQADGEEHAVFGNFTGDLQPRSSVRAGAGTMRLSRRGSTLRLEHGDEAGRDYSTVGERRTATQDPLYVGSKIWAGGPTGRLEVELSELRLDATAGSEQGPPVPVRPDPRG